jgi:ADP-ribose pyrophosphatase YjhB (NUDIX family)
VFQDDRLLLIQREDFEVWCLPGGQVEENESLAQAAKREAQEESGLEIELTRFVGTYSITRRLQRCAHVFLFAARPVRGHLRPQPGEALQACFLEQTEWPEAWLFGQRQQALDALAGVGGGSAWRYCTTWPFSPTITRREIYALRDRSGLSRSEFYYQHFKPFGPGDEILEVGAN